jgi:hypothetical protein
MMPALPVVPLRRFPLASSNESVTAGECIGGVRPSSGAAMLESNGNAIISGASGCSVLAAPEDGRTPPTSPSPPLRGLQRPPRCVAGPMVSARLCRFYFLLSPTLGASCPGIGHFAPEGCSRGVAGASPLPRRSTSVWLTEVLRRGNGEATARQWRAYGPGSSFSHP